MILEALRFGWNATRGHRLRPWRSPYVMWRMETYTGKKAESVGVSDIGELVWSERWQVLRFIQWLSAMAKFRHSQQGR